MVPLSRVFRHTLTLCFVFTPTPHNPTRDQYRCLAFLDALIWDEQFEHGYCVRTFIGGFRSSSCLINSDKILFSEHIIMLPGCVFLMPPFTFPLSFSHRFYLLFIFSNASQFCYQVERRLTILSTLLELLSILYALWTAAEFGCNIVPSSYQVVRISNSLHASVRRSYILIIITHLIPIILIIALVYMEDRSRSLVAPVSTATFPSICRARPLAHSDLRSVQEIIRWSSSEPDGKKGFELGPGWVSLLEIVMPLVEVNTLCWWSSHPNPSNMHSSRCL
jgi:hypothetical protein